MVPTQRCPLYWGPYKPPFGDCAIYSETTVINHPKNNEWYLLRYTYIYIYIGIQLFFCGPGSSEGASLASQQCHGTAHHSTKSQGFCAIDGSTDQPIANVAVCAHVISRLTLPPKL